jgi:hypothetical protein
MRNIKGCVGFRKRILLGTIVILIIGGLAAYKVLAEKEDKVALDTSSGATSQVKLPRYFDAAPPEVREAYEFALSRPDVLQYMACYCGCGKSAGHTSNKSCFIKHMDKDGTITLDEHGTMCRICLDVALTTKHLMAEGKSLREIRSILDKRYDGKPSTDTPNPPE